MSVPNEINVRMRDDQLRALAERLVDVADGKLDEAGFTVSGTHITSRGVTPDVLLHINITHKKGTTDAH